MSDEPPVGKARAINPFDRHIGARVRKRRMFRGLTLERLGALVGMRTQQVQKYESGRNRMSAQLLYQLAAALDVPVSYFFDDIPPDATLSGAGGNPRSVGQVASSVPEHSAFQEEDPLSSRETLQLVRNYYQLPQRVRRGLGDLVGILVDEAQGQPPVSMS